MQDDRSQSCFSTSLKQRTMVRMRICRHCRQTGGKELSLATIFRHVSFTKHLYSTKQTLVVY